MFHNVSSTNGSVRTATESQNTDRVFLQGTNNSPESMQTRCMSLFLLRQQLSKPWTSEQTKSGILHLLAHHSMRVHEQPATVLSALPSCQPPTKRARTE